LQNVEVQNQAHLARHSASLDSPCLARSMRRWRKAGVGLATLMVELPHHQEKAHRPLLEERQRAMRVDLQLRHLRAPR